MHFLFYLFKVAFFPKRIYEDKLEKDVFFDTQVLVKFSQKYNFHPTLTSTGCGWCMGMTQRDVVGREVGGGFMFGNACKN